MGHPRRGADLGTGDGQDWPVPAKGPQARRGEDPQESTRHLELEAAALIIGLVIALPVGIYSAVRQDTLGDYAGRSITIGTVIITEASLSFLGFGLPLNVPSWGGLLSREGRRYMQVAPWLAMWPGIFLTIVVYSLNMFGDAMRDLLDPRLRGGQGSYGATTKRKRSFLARLINPFNQ